MSANLIHNTRAIVLWARRGREADKIVGLFTESLGRLTARATSAAGSSARFVSLTEPFAESEVALYLAPGRGWGKLVGGRLLRSFPRLRVTMERGVAAAWVCEVTSRLTPEEQPSRDKYRLLAETLEALEEAADAGNIRLAFALRLLRLAGFGLDHRPAWRTLKDQSPEWAEALQRAPLASLGVRRWEAPAVQALMQLAAEEIHEHLARPLYVNRFRQLTGIQI